MRNPTDPSTPTWMPLQDEPSFAVRLTVNPALRRVGQRLMSSGMPVNKASMIWSRRLTRLRYRKA